MLRSRFGAATTVALAALAIASCATLAPTFPSAPFPDPTAIDLGAAASRAAVARRSDGCVKCHVGMTEPHPLADDPRKPGRFADRIGCTDCHGGDASATTVEAAHVQPANREVFASGAKPERSYTAWLRERWEFVRFVNPGDLRVAALSCGTTGCHADDVGKVKKSMMTHGAMLWEAALYNNGSYPSKIARFGESYGIDGRPQALRTVPPPTAEERARGVLAGLDPLPRFEVSHPSNVLRVFERGQKAPPEVGLPKPGEPGGGLEDEPGRPENRLSARGFGTGTRTDPVFLNLQRTRLLDPTLNMLGTNDQPGDYRSSGCTACHVIYANDRDALTCLRQGKDSPANDSAFYASFGNGGTSAQGDPTIPTGTAGHPIQHLMTRQIPSSQCVTCHMHPGTAVSNTYLGYTWWDLETDGAKMWPKEQRRPSAEEASLALQRNPEGSTPKGLWSDEKFLAGTGSPEFNASLKKMQLADFHGHGFLFKAVWKRDRAGHLLDGKGAVVAEDDPDRWKKSVHLKDIHLERGMQCVDCHFKTDSHGDGKLYGELRAATAIGCRDCHGTIERPTDLKTTGNAGGEDLAQSQTAFGKRFRWRGPAGKPGSTLVQQSALSKDVTWSVPQIHDSIDPRVNKKYSSDPKYERSRLAKTIRRDGKTWGALPGDASQLAHGDGDMACYSCHSSWMASCFGCHLPMKANERRPMLHNEGETQRNWTSYSWQTLREDAFMLGRDGTVTGSKIMPVRSACAVEVSSQNAQREWVYSQQQTVSAEGFSGTSFSPHFPHTVRAEETKRCTDCHVSANGDNNAVMAQLLMLGTNAYNFVGRVCWVAEGEKGFGGVVVTEHDEPQAVIGSRLHELAYPDDFAAHTGRGRVLPDAFEKGVNTIAGVTVGFGDDIVRSVQARGEYLYVALGPGGVRAYDIAEIDQKGFSERITTAPVSPLGQSLHVDTRNATSVRAPATQAVDPARAHDPANQEQAIHPLYAYLYVTDAEEGLILVNAATLLNGDPQDNFLERAVTFNPGGALEGAVNCTVAGEHVYVCCDRGVVVVSVADPLHPRIVAEMPSLRSPRDIEVQFRYAFVACASGIEVVDVTFPEKPRVIEEARLRMKDARSIYVVRTYAYVAAGSEGLAIVDVERPERPRVVERFSAGGAISDATDVKCAITNASLFAYVADGRNGLRVVQLTSPDETPGAPGFSPRPTPRLIATYPTRGPAIAVSEGLDRDRAVDEDGHQTAVFGRLGARPLGLEEMRRLYVKDGKVRTVIDGPPGPASEPASAAAAIEPEPRGERGSGAVAAKPPAERGTGAQPGSSQAAGIAGPTPSGNAASTSTSTSTSTNAEARWEAEVARLAPLLAPAGPPTVPARLGERPPRLEGTLIAMARATPAAPGAAAAGSEGAITAPSGATGAASVRPATETPAAPAAPTLPAVPTETTIPEPVRPRSQTPLGPPRPPTRR